MLVSTIQDLCQNHAALAPGTVLMGLSDKILGEFRNRAMD